MAAERVRAGRRHHEGERLRAELEIMDITESTRIRRDPNVALPGQLAITGDRVVLSFAGREVRMPVAAAPALEVVIDRTELTVGELDGLNPGSRLVLARRLLREGWLEIVR